MIVVRYTGGLGNQMFEYAMSFVLAERFPKEKIYADLSRYDLTREHNGFELEKYFEIHISRISYTTLRKIAPIHYFMQKMKLGSILKKCSLSKIERLNAFLEKRNRQVGIVEDLNSTNYNENAFELNMDSVTLWHYKGNWINPLYWRGMEKNVIQEFRFKTQLLDEIDRDIIQKIDQCESIAVHIRRGDYKNKYAFDLCDDKYYSSAVELIENQLKGLSIKYFIFSDEDVAGTLWNNENCTKISHVDNCGIDLYMMSRCKHMIIANSTFSYWAAMLNKNAGKIVVAPKYVYREKAMLRKLPIPHGWKVIDNVF